MKLIILNLYHNLTSVSHDAFASKTLPLLHFGLLWFIMDVTFLVSNVV